MLGLGFKTLPRTSTRIFFFVNQQTTCLFGFAKIFPFFFLFCFFFLRTEKTKFLKQKKSFFFQNRKNRILKTKEIFFFSFLRTEKTEFFKQKKSFFFFRKGILFFFFFLCLVKQGLVFLKKNRGQTNFFL